MDRDDYDHYRGLVTTTASLVAAEPGIEMEFDDVVQLLWIKVMHAIDRHDPDRSKVTVDRYVFGCLMNLRKDFRRRRPSRSVGFDDLGFQSQDRLESDLGLRVDHDAVYSEVEEDELVLPSTLTLTERGVIELLSSGYRQVDAAEFFGWTHEQMSRCIRAIRLKLADWAPDATGPAAEELSSAQAH